MAKKLRVKVKAGTGPKGHSHAGYEKEVPDKGKPGRTPKSKRWAKFSHKSGWKKDMPKEERLRVVVASEPKTMTLHNRRLKAARGLNQLANVTTDRETREKARSDAMDLFAKL